jgi:hypothetical protein
MALGSLSFARLRPVQIAALSVAYWIGLVAVKLGGALLAIARVALPGMHGSVGLELKNLMALHLTVTSSSGSVIWAGGTSLPAVVAWIAGPPLILAVTARWARELDAGDEMAGSAALGGDAARPLGGPRPDWDAGVRGPASEAERRSRGPERESP